MSSVTKLFAVYEWDYYRRDNDSTQTHEVKDLQEGVKLGSDKKADFFYTYEVVIVTVNGKTYTGEPENHSGRKYLHVDKIYTPDEAVQKTEQTSIPTTQLSQITNLLARSGMAVEAKQIKDAFTAESMADPFRNQPSDARFVKLPYKGFVRLEDTDTAYDINGSLIWPIKNNPAPQSNSAPEAEKISPPLRKPPNRWNL